MQRDLKIFHLIQQAHSTLFRASDYALRSRFGIGTAQQAILFALHRKDGVALSTIAAQLSLTKSSLSGLIDRMVAAKLVRREQSPDDARSFLLFLEPRGRDCVLHSLPETKRINAQLLAPFSTEERKVIERFLKHVTHEASAVVENQKPAQTKSPSQKEFT